VDIASKHPIGHLIGVGWIAKPGSAENRLNKWLDRIGLTRILLWCSAFQSALIGWTLYDILVPDRRVLAVLPFLYATGALAVARHLGKVERPSAASWLAAAFFLLPVLLQIAESLGLIDGIGH
jgi:hypothetical protein